jgi:hypothetical protein
MEYLEAKQQQRSVDDPGRRFPIIRCPPSLIAGGHTRFHCGPPLDCCVLRCYPTPSNWILCLAPSFPAHLFFSCPPPFHAGLMQFGYTREPKWPALYRTYTHNVTGHWTYCNRLYEPLTSCFSQVGSFG